MASTSSLIVLCGPSGSGKSTLLKRLMDEFKDKFGFSVSHTTRKSRPGEIDGREYHFVSEEEFAKLKTSGAFVEFAKFSGNNYGTSRKAIQDVIDQGKHCILDIDVQGVESIKQTDLTPKFIFIKPPSLETLEKRLRDRGTENEEAIKKRLSVAAAEITYGETPGNFDIIIVNDDLERAYSELKGFIFNENKKHLEKTSK